MGEPVIVGGVRTPFGRRNGAFRDTHPAVLLSGLLDQLTKKTGVDKGAIGDVVCGCVSPVQEQGANIGRVATLRAGFPVQVPAVTLNRMCGSSQQAIHFAAQEIAAGDVSYAIGCGIENMSRVPMGSDFMLPTGGFSIPETGHDLIHQGESSERIAEKYGLTRKDVDEFSIESHRRASAAIKAGKYKEVVSTSGVDAEGKGIDLTRDEGVRDVIDPAKIASLKPAFRPEGQGVTTAANSSQISDGASAVLVADRDRAKADGLTPKFKFRARVAVGDDPTIQLMGVVPATKLALERAKLSLNDIDWIEINEAFATVVLGWAKELKPNMEKVNPMGGAIAHGHPLGATGAGLMAKMCNALESHNLSLGLQVMCIGHGMATCTIIERIG